ncbi:outer membrane beta-barrel family protein [Pedobacter gandavensis]|uniref:outer membrane beta-barrel family protein n=1 Tax=Pedobacter gandavensis TaxID=2679963 RepID=UPI00292F4586|nr:outer membrane beta-barrel family protein [Pedobacter gandavensis]
MRKINLISSLFFLSALSVNAQSITIKGKVYAKNKQPLPSVSITLKGTSGKQRSIVSKTQGDFEFVNLDKETVYALRISHVGYIAIDTIITTPIADTSKVLMLKSMYLEEQAQQMAEVNIKSKVKVIELRGDKVIFNVSKSPVATGKTLYDAIKQIPGVFEQNGSLSFQGNKISIYIDGRQNYLSGAELKLYLQSQPASSVDLIEVLPHPSAKYDAQGGSVVNIKSMVNKNYGTNGTILIGGGQGRYFQNNQGLALNYRNKAVNVYGSYNHLHSKKYADNYSDRVLGPALNIINDEKRKLTSEGHMLKAGLDWDINKNNTVGVLLKTNFTDLNKSWNSATRLKYAGASSDSTSLVNTNGNNSYVVPSVNVYYKSVLDTANRTLTFNFDYFKYDKSSGNEYITDFYDTQGIAYNQTKFRDNSPTINNVYAAALDFSNPLKNGSFEAGIKSYITKTDNNTVWETINNNSWNYDPSRSNHFIYKEFINAVYANYMATFKKINLTAGLRYELTHTEGNLATQGITNKRNYSNLFPSISLGYNASAKHVFGISYRKSIQRFGLDVVNPFIFYKNPYEYYQGNPNIKPEISHSLSLSYTYNRFMSFNLNYIKADDALAPVYFKGNNNILISSQDNLSNSKTFYFSNSVYTSPKEFWDISLSNMVGFIQFNQYVDGANLLNNSNWIYQGNLSNSFNMGKGFSSELTVMYLSPFSQGIYETKNLFQMDLGLSKSLFDNKANIRCSVSDIFNTFSTRYNVNYQGVNAYYRQKDESRFFNLSLSYKFGNSNVKRSKTRNINSDEIRNRMN